MQEQDCLLTMKKICKIGEGKAVTAQGASGGILTWWNSNIYKFISAIENCHWLFVEIESLETQETLWIGNVYGPIIHGCKEELWTQLEQQRHGTMQFPCIIAGDFNATIYLEGKKGGSKVEDPFGEILEDIINERIKSC